MSTTTPSQLHRREFLVASAIAGSTTLIPLATGRPLGQPDTRGSSSVPRPTLARVRDTLAEHGGVESGDGPRYRLVAETALAGLGRRVTECGLRIQPMASSLSGATVSIDLEVHYPVAGVSHLVWTAEPAVVGQVDNPSGYAMSAGAETVAPTDALGRVHLRVTTRDGHGSQSHAFAIPSAPGSHVMAIPVCPSARTPAWRRCTCAGDRAERTTIHDSWKAGHAAPGCALLRIDLFSRPHHTNPSAAEDSANHGGA